MYFGIMAMEANKRRIFYSGVIAGILVSIGAFIIYTNIATQKKLRLPDSADGVFSILVSEASCEHGTLYKAIPDRQGIESMIDVFRQVEIDFSRPEEWRSYAGATGRTIVLSYRDGTERTVDIAVLGGDTVVYYPSRAQSGSGYRGTWPNSENFFQSLDYPCRHLVYCETGQDSYKGPDT